MLRSDFESEAYFGAGWSDAQRTPAGPVRQGDDGATLLLPLRPAPAYRLTLDLVADRSVGLAVTINGVSAGVCDPYVTHRCDVPLSSTAIRHGVNAIAFLARGDDHARSRLFTFRGARLRITPVTAP